DRSAAPLTATQELTAAIKALRAWDGCCAGAAPGPASEAGSRPFLSSTDRIVVETQDGVRHDLRELLGRQRTLLAFFYTRCMNPEKCSLTVTRLAAIAQALERSPKEPDLRVLACSYDPDFDRGQRLTAYGRDRGFPFSERAMMLRCIE